MSGSQDGNLGQDVDPPPGVSNRFDKDGQTFTKSQVYLVALFGFLFLATCFCCRMHVTATRRQRLDAEEDDGLTPEERKARRTETIKKGIITKAWTPPAIEKRDEETPNDSGTPDESNVPISSRLTSVLQTTSTNLVKTLSQIAVVEDDGTPEHACAICLNEYTADDVVAYSDGDLCRHEFHEECIISWLMKHKDCPLCRHIYLTDDNDVEQQRHRGGSAAHEALENSTLTDGIAGNADIEQQYTDISVHA